MRFMIRDLLWLTVVIGLACVILAPYLASPGFLGETEDMKGVTYVDRALSQAFVTTISDDLVEKSPAWDRTEANPPVSAKSALGIAEQFRRERLKGAPGWQWQLQSLALLPLDGQSNKWCWSVTFVANRVEGGSSGIPPVFTVVVLMDREVIVPQEEEYDYLKEWGLLEGETPADSRAN